MNANQNPNAKRYRIELTGGELSAISNALDAAIEQVMDNAPMDPITEEPPEDAKETERDSRMTEVDFQRELCRAATMKDFDDRPDYWTGYALGLRRAYHGERFWTVAEHERRLALVGALDSTQRQLGEGYRDGLAFGATA